MLGDEALAAYALRVANAESDEERDKALWELDFVLQRATSMKEWHKGAHEKFVKDIKLAVMVDNIEMRQLREE